MTVEEAQGLIQVLKKLMSKGSYLFPKPGETDVLELESVFSNKDKFFVNINRSSKINPKKYTLLLRYGRDNGLIRVDVGGPPHPNPDGSIVPCPHIHLQQNDYGQWDKWAASLPAVFGNSDDLIETFIDFLKYCNVNNISDISIYSQEKMG